MATPLSDEIRALIAYANETTGAGDTLLGDAVRTLCEGYGGGGDDPVPEVVSWYDYIVGNADVWIDTGVTWTPDLKIEISSVAVGTSNTYDHYIDNEYTGRLNRWYSVWRRYGKVFEAQAGIASVVTQQILLPSNTALKDRLQLDLVFNDKEVTIIGQNLTKGERGESVATTSFDGTENPIRLRSYCNLGASTYVTRFKVWHGAELYRDLRPCTCFGEPGMWDTVEGKFYGNANPSGGSYAAAKID